MFPALLTTERESSRAFNSIGSSLAGRSVLTKERRPYVGGSLVPLRGDIFAWPRRALVAPRFSSAISPSMLVNPLPRCGSQQFYGDGHGRKRHVCNLGRVLEGAAGGQSQAQDFIWLPRPWASTTSSPQATHDPTQERYLRLCLCPGLSRQACSILIPARRRFSQMARKALYGWRLVPSAGFLKEGHAEVYNPVHATTSAATGSMVIGRCSETATLLQSGKVLFAGGQARRCE